MTPTNNIYSHGHLQQFQFSSVLTHNCFTALFQDHPGEPVPEENFWTLWCRERLTEADTPTIWLGATPSGLTSAHLHHPRFFTGRMAFLLMPFPFCSMLMEQNPKGAQNPNFGEPLQPLSTSNPLFSITR